MVEGSVFRLLHLSQSQNLWVSEVEWVEVLVSVLGQGSVLSLSFCPVGEAAFLAEEEGAHGPSQEAERAPVYLLTHPSSGLDVVEWHSSPTSSQ